MRFYPLRRGVVRGSLLNPCRDRSLNLMATARCLRTNQKAWYARAPPLALGRKVFLTALLPRLPDGSRGSLIRQRYRHAPRYGECVAKTFLAE